jgi:RND superfamily putative drug exporter
VFATLSGIDVKMLGVGLAVAVLIDATVVRGIILPAALALLGERAWVMPRVLAWVPGYRAAGTVSRRPSPALPALSAARSRAR